MANFSSTPTLENMLSSLPKQEGIVLGNIYKYQGFWHTPLGLQGLINCQQHFEAREHDIYLMTAPKSGTTWLKAIIYALINRDICLPQDDHHPLLTKSSHQLVPSLEPLEPSNYNSIYSSSSDNSSSSTRIFASHFPNVSQLPKSIMEVGKIVYLCRDIKDNFVSLFRFSDKAGVRPSTVSFEKAFDLFSQGASPSGPVWDQILGYWKVSLERPDKVLFMRYEDMTNEPHVQLRRLAHFLGKPFSQEDETSGLLDDIIKLCSFDSMSKVNKTGKVIHGVSNDSFFGSGVVGGWRKNYLTAEMATKLDRITEEKFRGSGLTLT